MRIIERRKCKSDEVTHFGKYLNTAQMKTFTNMTQYGWKLYFIRRSLLRKPTVVMINNSGTRVAVIEQDGRSTDNLMRISWRRKLNSSSRLISSPCWIYKRTSAPVRARFGGFFIAWICSVESKRMPSFFRAGRIDQIKENYYCSSKA